MDRIVLLVSSENNGNYLNRVHPTLDRQLAPASPDARLTLIDFRFTQGAW